MIANADRLAELEAEQVRIIKELESLEDSYATARQVCALRDDRLKKEFSMLVVEFIRAGNAAGASEHMARADERYTGAIKMVLKDTANAQKILTHWDVLHTKFEATTALMNNERAKMKLI